jgi:hypothetical protein
MNTKLYKEGIIKKINKDLEKRDQLNRFNINKQMGKQLDKILFHSRIYKNYRLYQVANRLPQIKLYREAVYSGKSNTPQRYQTAQRLMHSNGVRVKRIPENWWVVLISCIDDKATEEILVDNAKTIDYKLLSPGEWLEFSSFMIGLMFYETALIFRKKALDKAMAYLKGKNIINKIIYADMALGATIETFDLEMLPKSIKTSQFLGGSCSKNPNMEIMNSLIKTRKWTYFDETELDFKKIIEKKKIAIVGPLTDEEAYEDEINSSDLVIKLNLVDLEKVKSKLRNDILYLANPVMPKFIEINAGKPFNQSTAVVSRSQKYLQTLTGEALFRSMPELNPFTFNGGLNMIQRTIIDLSRFCPKQIKVYGTNLYASLNYNENYQGIVSSSGYRYYLDQLVQHDLITQFKVTKRLHDLGMFVGDTELEKILALDLEGYLRKIKSVYKENI